MVQNIRPPQDIAIHQPSQSAGEAKSVRGGGGKVEADVTASTPTQGQVEQAAARIKDVLRGTTPNLEFEIDPDLKRMDKVVIKIRNAESGEVIRQIPAQELLDLPERLDDLKGLLVRERA